MVASKLFRRYITDIQQNLKLGNATEHTHRPAFKAFLESAYDDVIATNEPGRIECGAPDFSISKGAAPSPVTIGYIEAKDVGADLYAIERDSERANSTTLNGQQIKRYKEALPNLILTNYTEFRWYVDGDLRLATRLSEYDGNLSVSNDSISQTDDLLSSFLAHSPEPISSPIDLAERMARLTHIVRDIVQEGMIKRRASQDVNDLYQAAKEALVPNLTLDEFSDMFAQTLAYGLFAARVNHDSGNFHRRDAVYDIPAANPFLRQIFSLNAGPNAENEPFIGFVDDLAQLLANSDMEAILADFGKRDVRQDPVMNFYEPFLAAYDPQLRERRGVYYTPEPVISYIVRSVDLLLKERFGCAEGLADYQHAEYEVLEQVDGEQKKVTKQAHRVLVLDPACGTGSFLYAVIDHIRRYYRDSGNAGMWNGYVREHLLNRIFGFELMMAPYAMSHLKLGMQLAAQDILKDERNDWAYRFGDNERLGVYLTNSLEQAEQQTATLFGPMRIISEEANAASEIKRDLPIMVVLGNPPYSGHSANASRWGRKLTWIGELIEDYKKVDGKPLGERNPKWLQDDYVKFIRFGQWRINQSGAGILAFITNNGYLDNPTFRGMRQQLMDTFTDIYLLDLHGNSNKKERAPDGGVDENVFDIRQGVSIAIFVRTPGISGPAKVRHADLWGDRTAKYSTLEESDVSTTDWELLEPASPKYLFKPWDNTYRKEYEQWPSVKSIFSNSATGFQTHRDKTAIGFDKSSLYDQVERYLKREPDPISWKRYSSTVAYRPLDLRYGYLSTEVTDRPRLSVMRHMLEDNLGLNLVRQTKLDFWAHSFISRYPTPAIFLEIKDGSSVFPLYTYASEQEIAQGLYEAGDRQPNLAPGFTDDLEQRIGLQFVGDCKGDLRETFGPEDVLHYIYAVFHSPTYRERYDQFLRSDFPRVPIPDSPDLFRALARIGLRLTNAHLMNSNAPSPSPIGFPVTGDNIIEKAHPKYYAPGKKPPGVKSPLERGRVYISKSNRRSGKRGQHFDGVTPEIWEFRIGGYQPMRKWLQDRQGRALTFDDLRHYRRIASAIKETILLMQEVDTAITQNGGLW